MDKASIQKASNGLNIPKEERQRPSDGLTRSHRAQSTRLKIKIDSIWELSPFSYLPRHKYKAPNEDEK
ncbi:unnamed protein product [Peronospora belbahrii]|uniref:Uncharacterized protein n=1 Tax=Peronospora belbahrii TaxID=622444 RepID=A0ABN8D4A1_9STRA|nr:unnamed protein product [Peronospora belbahrii]